MIPFIDFLIYYFPILSYDTYLETSFFELEEIINIFPEIFLGLSILFLLLHGVLTSSNLSNNYPLVQNSINNIGILILLLTVFLLKNFIFSMDCSLFNNTVILDILGTSSKYYILIASILLLLLIKPYIKHQQINSFEYLLLILFSVFGTAFLCSSNDFITAYLCIEVQSLSFYLLAAYKKDSIFSTEAGLKYFILGSLSSGMFLFGTSIIYGATGTTNFEDLKDFFFFSPDKVLLDNFYFDFHLINFGLIFIIISLFFKLSLAPFHVWSPDVYEGSLTSSAAFFAILPKLGLFILFIRIFQFSFYSLIETWKVFMILIGLFSVIIGSFVGLEVRRIKSLLAYSSISHMGYILLALSTGSFEGMQSMMGYLIVYILTSLSIWAIILSLKTKTHYLKKNNKDLSDFSLLNKSNVSLSIFFAISLFSLAGFPPLIGFYVKLKVFFSLIEDTQYLSAILAILCSVISTFYYIRIIKVLFFEKKLVGNLYYPLTYYSSFIITLSFFFLVFLFINPNLFFLNCYKICF